MNKQIIMEKILDAANNAYHNSGNNTMTDNEFDCLKEQLVSEFPDSKYKDKIGEDVINNKIKLPFHLGSMNKLKTDKSINNWTKKYNGSYCVMDKLDGCSALYIYKEGKYKLFTRGNGNYGQDISKLLDYLNLPKINVNKLNYLAVRGELIIKESLFKSKYNKLYSNSRNFVAGIINSKNVDRNIIKDLDFVSYEILHPLMKIDAQLIALEKLNFNVCKSVVLEEVNQILLTEELKKRKLESKYIIDGIIVRDNNLYANPMENNPKYAFAFKLDCEEEYGISTVLNINWNISRYGFLKPQISIEPLKLNGVTIKNITGKNAKFIVENKIGINTILKIKRSGDVIPEIVEIIKCSNEPLLPSVEYIWNETNVDILIKKDCKDLNNNMNIKLITNFFKKLNTQNLSEGIVTKLYNNGYNSISKIIHMKIEDYLKIDGFKLKLSEKIYNNIKNALFKCTIIDLMNASNSFGRGFSFKKLELIYNSFPHILEMNISDSLKDKIKSINGFSEKTSEQFINNLNNFKKFIKELNININDKLPTEKYIPVNRKNVILTGFRCDKIKKKINELGYNINDNINKQTILVIAKDENYNSSKIDKAKKLNIEIITLEKFINKYKL